MTVAQAQAGFAPTGNETTARDDVETRLEQVCAAFSSALDDVAIDPDDDFFEMGGDSLNAEGLSLQLSEVLGQEVPMAALLDYPTPREIERAFPAHAAPVATATQGGTPYFIVHGKMGYSLPRPTFRAGLKPGRPLVMFELPGIRDDRPTPLRIEGIAAVYIEELTRAYPSGPIYLSSFCRGAMIALEMAHQLAEAGRPVHKLALIDPSAAKSVVRRYRGRADSLAHRVMTWPMSGRFTGVTTAEDFDDDALLAARVRAKQRRYAVKSRVRRLREALGLQVREDKARSRSFDPAAMLQLTTSYEHYWPKAFTGPVDVICSANRARVFKAKDGLFQSIVPQLRVHHVLDEHHDIGSQIAAETLEAVFAADAGDHAA